MTNGGEEAEALPRLVPVLTGPRATLRPAVPEDAASARRLGLYPEIVRLFGEQPEPEWRELTPTEADELARSLAPSSRRVNWIVDVGQGFVGTARLHSFDDEDGCAAYAIGLLDPAILGRGLGTEITHLVSAYAFHGLSLEALMVRVLECNARAIACYARCGFVELRREPDAVVLDGVSCADVIMRLDADRYRELSAQPASLIVS